MQASIFLNASHHKMNSIQRSSSSRLFSFPSQNNSDQSRAPVSCSYSHLKEKLAVKSNNNPLQIPKVYEYRHEWYWQEMDHRWIYARAVGRKQDHLLRNLLRFWLLHTILSPIEHDRKPHHLIYRRKWRCCGVGHRLACRSGSVRAYVTALFATSALRIWRRPVAAARDIDLLVDRAWSPMHAISIAIKVTLSLWVLLQYCWMQRLQYDSEMQ